MSERAGLAQMEVKWQNAPAILSCLWILFLIAGAALASFFAQDPQHMETARALEAPSLHHFLGTDQLGRDVFSRMLYGSRISLSVGFIAVGIATLIGLLVGAVAGYAGGKIDRLLMIFTDVMLCFPTFFLILAIVALLEPSIFHIMAVIGVTGWMGTARLVRAEVLSLKEREFVLSARALGADGSRILIRHILPNAMGPVFVTAVLGIAHAVLVESALSFLGIGVQPPTPSWGNILADGKAALGVAWWLTLFPGLAILFTVLSCNLIGEEIRESGERRRSS